VCADNKLYQVDLDAGTLDNKGSLDAADMYSFINY